MSLLPPAELDALIDTAIEDGLNDPQARLLLMSGIPSRVRGAIPVSYSPTDQLKLDLRYLNKADNLPDGSIPLLSWLRDAADRKYGSTGAKTYLSVYMKISARSPTAHLLVDIQPKDAGGREIKIGRNDLLPYSFFEAGVAAGKSVAKMLVPIFKGRAPELTAGGEHSTGSGTGWTLSGSLVLTNHHVMEARAPGIAAEPDDFDMQVGISKAQFDYDFDEAGGDVISIKECLVSDRDLDYALLRLKDDSGRKPLLVRHKAVVLNPANPLPVNIIQHPNGSAKQIGIRNNLANDSTADVLTYFTDTLEGSSGSPVMNDNWEVLALHRGYQPVSNIMFQGKSEAYANYGTHLVRILQHIREKRSDVWSEVLAAQPKAALIP